MGDFFGILSIIHWWIFRCNSRSVHNIQLRAQHTSGWVVVQDNVRNVCPLQLFCNKRVHRSWRVAIILLVRAQQGVTDTKVDCSSDVLLAIPMVRGIPIHMVPAYFLCCFIESPHILNNLVGLVVEVSNGTLWHWRNEPITMAVFVRVFENVAKTVTRVSISNRSNALCVCAMECFAVGRAGSL